MITFFLFCIQLDWWSMITLFLFCIQLDYWSGLPCGSEVKASASNVRDLNSIPESGRSPGEGNGNPLQYSCLENPMDGEACMEIK